MMQLVQIVLQKVYLYHEQQKVYLGHENNQ